MQTQHIDEIKRLKGEVSDERAQMAQEKQEMENRLDDEMQ